MSGYSRMPQQFQAVPMQQQPMPPGYYVANQPNAYYQQIVQPPTAMGSVQQQFMYPQQQQQMAFQQQQMQQAARLQGAGLHSGVGYAQQQQQQMQQQIMLQQQQQQAAIQRNQAVPSPSSVAPPPTAAVAAAAGVNKAPVSIAWVRKLVGAALSMDGNDMASCLDDTQLPSFLNLPINMFDIKGTEAHRREVAAGEATTFMSWLRHVMHTETTAIAAKRGSSEAAVANAKRFLEPFIAVATAVFVLNASKMLQPPKTAPTNATGAARSKGKKSNANAAAGGGGGGGGVAGIVDPTDLTAVLEGCNDATRNVYLKALMHACDSLQALHTERRNPKNCNNFPGWDTAVVISLVHIIQNVAQSVEGEIDGGVMGDIMRNWRKLFVFLQSCDENVPNESSRRRGALAVVNSLLILLFQQDNTHQCRIILSTIDNAERIAEQSKDTSKSIVKSSSHLIAEMIKFRYFQGRIRLFDRNYDGALAAFCEASRLLPPMPLLSDAVTKAGGKKGSENGPLTVGLSHPLSMGTAPPGVAAAAVAASIASVPPNRQPVPEGMNAAQRDNKLRVTYYQITAAILCGLRVPPHVLSVDPTAAKVFKPIVAAIQCGSPAAFTMALDLHGSSLRIRSVYMVLQQARIYCYLTLLQRVHAAVAESGKDSSMIPIPLLVEALAAANHGCCDEGSEGYLFSTEESPSEVQLAEGTATPNNEVFRLVKKMRVEVDARLESDDILMWMARLIARGLVRGYLSREHQMLVLSKNAPFPPPAYSFSLI